jgi:hypothetical protein
MRQMILSAALTAVMLTGCGSDESAPASTTVVPVAVTTAVPAATVPAATVPATTATPTTVAGPKPLPPVQVPADTYRIDEFSVPFVITTQGDWTRFNSRQELFHIGRGSNAATEFIVTSGLVAGSTPQEALDTWCDKGAIDLAEPSTTTLLGKPAIQQDGTVNGVCNWAALDTTLPLVIPAGNTVRLVAADVGGKIVVVVADGPSADWSTLSIEVDAMIASMALAG